MNLTEDDLLKQGNDLEKKYKIRGKNASSLIRGDGLMRIENLVKRDYVESKKEKYTVQVKLEGCVIK